MSKGRWRVTINPCSHDYVEDDESGHMRCMFCKQIVFERDEKGRKTASDLAKKKLAARRIAKRAPEGKGE